MHYRPCDYKAVLRVQSGFPCRSRTGIPTRKGWRLWVQPFQYARKAYSTSTPERQKQYFWPNQGERTLTVLFKYYAKQLSEFRYWKHQTRLEAKGPLADQVNTILKAGVCLCLRQASRKKIKERSRCPEVLRFCSAAGGLQSLAPRKIRAKFPFSLLPGEDAPFAAQGAASGPPLPPDCWLRWSRISVLPVL